MLLRLLISKGSKFALELDLRLLYMIEHVANRNLYIISLNYFKALINIAPIIFRNYWYLK